MSGFTSKRVMQKLRRIAFLGRSGIIAKEMENPDWVLSKQLPEYTRQGYRALSNPRRSKNTWEDESHEKMTSANSKSPGYSVHTNTKKVLFSNCSTQKSVSKNFLFRGSFLCGYKRCNVDGRPNHNRKRKGKKEKSEL